MKNKQKIQHFKITFILQETSPPQTAYDSIVNYFNCLNICMKKPNICTTFARSQTDESNSKSALLSSSEKDKHAFIDACHGQQLQVQTHTHSTSAALPHQLGQAGKAAWGLAHLPLWNKGN